MDIKWNKEMVTDFRIYQSGLKTVIPGCWHKSLNITSVAVSRNHQTRVNSIFPPLSCLLDTAFKGQVAQPNFIIHCQKKNLLALMLNECTRNVSTRQKKNFYETLANFEEAGVQPQGSPIYCQSILQYDFFAFNVHAKVITTFRLKCSVKTSDLLVRPPNKNLRS